MWYWQMAAAAVGVLSATASAASDDITIAWLGVTMAVVLASFAGAMIALSFTPILSPVRAVGSVLSGTVGGAYLSPLAMRAAVAYAPGSPSLDQMDKPVAFLLGLAFQFVVPIVLHYLARKGNA